MMVVRYIKRKIHVPKVYEIKHRVRRKKDNEKKKEELRKEENKNIYELTSL